MNDLLKSQIALLPKKPGVYLMKDVDDKIIKQAKLENKSEKELTDYYIGEFLKVTSLIGSMAPNITPRVTEYIQKIIDYVDSETGEVFYQLEGEKSYIYDEPISIDVDVAYSGGEVRQAEYGINDSDYDATLVYMLNEFPITETTLIWINSEPKKVNGYIDSKSADYIVSKVIPSLNTTRVLLKRRVK